MYDRYKFLRNENGEASSMPFFPISISDKDKYEEYTSKKYSSRLDCLADKYYDDPTLYFLILMANPSYRNEFDMPDGLILRIPFPKERVLQELDDKMRVLSVL